MAKEGKHRDELKARARRAAGYRPARKSKLVVETEPPPLPQAGASEPDGFGAAAEDGLRMLAALRSVATLEPELEPGYGDDLGLEATVSIVEHAEGSGRSTRSLKSRLEDVSEDTGAEFDAGPPLARYGPIEEAEVEIVDLPQAEPVEETPARARRSSLVRTGAKASKNRR